MGELRACTPRVSRSQNCFLLLLLFRWCLSRSSALGATTWDLTRAGLPGNARLAVFQLQSLVRILHPRVRGEVLACVCWFLLRHACDSLATFDTWL